MNEKQYEECFERLDKYVFSRDMAVKEDWYDLLNYHHNQLQAYKDKEDKLEHYVHTLFFENHFEKEEQFKKCQKEILQILNEGSDS